jgi:hypothetical protein
LQVAEQVPADIQIAGRGNLVERFLDAVLAEDALAGRNGIANRRYGKCFRDGDEGNRGRVAIDRPGGALDARADPGQSIGD